uniref:GIY-YIG homing endonuclease n=1 Tax=Pseudopediastrum boryanum TaxID=55410 RepID=E2QAR6_PSEBY|nr:GIY-YIG homing endonuclease [Pseudopediastrum boryanum]
MAENKIESNSIDNTPEESPDEESNPIFAHSLSRSEEAKERAKVGAKQDDLDKNKKCKIDPNIVEKGLKSLDNPVLRGSFSLVLDKPTLEFLENIAKMAFKEVIEQELFDVTLTSDYLDTIHLSTDRAKVQNKRSGVYIIKHVETGMCVVGQTTNLKKRFNQYTSRSTNPIFSLTNKINKELYVAVQENLQKNLVFGQFMQRYVAYCWVDENKKPINVFSLELINQKNYLEHQLILALHECGLCYNTNDVAPQLVESPVLPDPSLIGPAPLGKVSSTSFPLPVVGPKRGKPFKVNNLYFLTGQDYAKYRESLSVSNRKHFLSMPRLRLKLCTNSNDSNNSTRYLSDAEVQEAKNKNLFVKPTCAP